MSRYSNFVSFIFYYCQVISHSNWHWAYCWAAIAGFQDFSEAFQDNSLASVSASCRPPVARLSSPVSCRLLTTFYFLFSPFTFPFIALHNIYWAKWKMENGKWEM